jgi:hypothetical protein
MQGLDYYDYSARMYDPVQTRFTTMDPLAEKYYSVSPYVYALNNPILYVDPDGKDVLIWYQNDENKWGTWSFTGSNHRNAPNNQFVQNFLTAYDYNVNNGGGEKMQQAAIATGYTLNLRQTKNSSNFQTTFNGPRTEGTVFWNPYEGLETSKGTLSPATILEHEMDHGVQWQTKTSQYLNDRSPHKSSVPHFGNKEEERVITGSEYKTGVANGELKPIPIGRIGNSSSYRGHESGNGIFVPVTSPIFNKNKQ